MIILSNYKIFHKDYPLSFDGKYLYGKKKNAINNREQKTYRFSKYVVLFLSRQVSRK